LPSLSVLGAVKQSLQIGTNYAKINDYGWLELLGGQNLNYQFSIISKYLQILQNNNLKIYLMIFFFWISIYLILSI
jgi:hypothetical protein